MKSCLKFNKLIEMELAYYLAKDWDVFVERARVYTLKEGLSLEIYMIVEEDTEENIGFAISTVLGNIQKRRSVEFISSKVIPLL